MLVVFFYVLYLYCFFFSFEGLKEYVFFILELGIVVVQDVFSFVLMMFGVVVVVGFGVVFFIEVFILFF